MNGWTVQSRATQRNAHLCPPSAGAAKQIMNLRAQQFGPRGKEADGRGVPGHPATAAPLVNIYSFSFCLETGGAQSQIVKKIPGARRSWFLSGVVLAGLYNRQCPHGFCAGLSVVVRDHTIYLLSRVVSQECRRVWLGSGCRASLISLHNGFPSFPQETLGLFWAWHLFSLKLLCLSKTYLVPVFIPKGGL